MVTMVALKPLFKYHWQHVEDVGHDCHPNSDVHYRGVAIVGALEAQAVPSRPGTGAIVPTRSVPRISVRSGSDI